MHQCQIGKQRVSLAIISHSSSRRLGNTFPITFIEMVDCLAKRKPLQPQLELQRQHNQPIAERELIAAERLLQQFQTDWESDDLGRRKEMLNAKVESIRVTQGKSKASAYRLGSLTWLDMPKM